MGKKIHETSGNSLILRGSIWHARFVINGITVARSTKTSNRREAERIVAKWKSELIQDVVLGNRKPIRLHEAIDLFLKSRSGLPSQKNATTHLNRFLTIKNQDVSRITDQELHGVLDGMREQGYRTSTISVTVNYFNALINFLQERDYTVRKKLALIKGVKGRIRWLTDDELTRLWSAIDPQELRDPVSRAQRQENLDLAQLLYETAARYSEIANMTWTQVDLAAETVTIIRGKGSNNGTLHFTDRMREIFNRRRRLDQGELVFATKAGRHNETHWMRAAVRRAGLSTAQGSVSLHTLRHTRAVHLLQRGMNLLEVKEILGHRSINSTLVYLHLTPGAAARRMVELSQVTIPAP